MTSAITASGSNAAAAYGAARPSPAGLQAQLQRFQQQLSDCVNCASASTPQGKADIAAIAARISQVQKNIAAIDNDAGRNGSQNATVASLGGGVTRAGSIDVYA